MTASIKIFKNTEEVADEFANSILQLAKDAKGQPVHIALSGGSTPKAIFKQLAAKYKQKLNNKQFHFWWGDDRCVPPTDDDSNYKWANDLWLKPIGIPKENIHRVLGEADPADEAKRYGGIIEQQLPCENKLPVFDYMLLGLGEDGHTASIFPHQIEFISSDETCVVATHPDTGQKRISLTGPVINNSRNIIFLAMGAKKAEKVKEVYKDKSPALPATHIQPLNGNLTWYLDSLAAKLI